MLVSKPTTKGSWKIKFHPGTRRLMLVSDNPRALGFETELKLVMGRDAPPALLTGPAAVRVQVYLARPRSHFGSGRNRGRVLPSAPAYPTGPPDADKLLRIVGDAMQGVWLRNDAQVVRVEAEKAYGEPERIEVEAWALAAGSGEPAAGEDIP